VLFWLGFWFWWEHPGADLGRFFASLAVVCTWGDRPASGLVGGGPWVTRRCPRRFGADLCPSPGRAAGAVFFYRGSRSEMSGWIERAGSARPGPAKFRRRVYSTQDAFGWVRQLMVSISPWMGCTPSRIQEVRRYVKFNRGMASKECRWFVPLLWV
jgi:hypothetical protein